MRQRSQDESQEAENPNLSVPPETLVCEKDLPMLINTAYQRLKTNLRQKEHEKS